jgi:hypothetical protein
MNATAARLTAFGAALVAIFLAAAALGAAVGPIDVGGDTDHHDVPVTTQHPPDHPQHSQP